ncbi:MAG: hypothetical protein Kow00133_15870 [Amphiplicatus sp.]
MTNDLYPTMGEARRQADGPAPHESAEAGALYPSMSDAQASPAGERREGASRYALVDGLVERLLGPRW